MFFSKKINQFFAVANCQSLVKAADLINVTPSALRHGLNELESQVGQSLVKRSKTGVTLTPTGKALYEKLFPYYEKIKSIENQISGIKEDKQNLAIKLDGLYYPDLKTKLLSIKQNSHCYNLSLTDGYIDNIENELFKDGFDLVISSLDFEYSNKNIQSVDLCTQKVGMLTHKILLDKHKNQSMKQFFKEETLIQRSSTLQNPIFISTINRLQKKGYQCHTLGLTEMSDVLHFINEGAGYCFIPENAHFISSITNEQVQFIRSPFPFDVLLHQKVYFKKDNQKDLADIAMTLR
ncbi:MAG TPA: hypothetical protein DEV59_12380 [Proteus sp.]|nr:hypothetical protein [Proteus sp. (in: enterobacteria)]